MKLTFYLQYFSYEDENFQVNDNYYKDSNDYIKKLEESYNQTKDVIFDAMSSGNYIDKNTYKMPFNKVNSNKKKDNLSYAKCEGIIIDENLEEIGSKSIGILTTIQDMFVGTIRLNSSTIEEEFETSWRMFLDSTRKITSYDVNEDWKFIHKPYKDIYFSYEDDDKNTRYCKLTNCRILESYDTYSNVLIIEKMEKIDKLD